MKIFRKKGDGTFVEYSSQEDMFWSDNSNDNLPDWLGYTFTVLFIICIIIVLCDAYL